MCYTACCTAAEARQRAVHLAAGGGNDYSSAKERVAGRGEQDKQGCLSVLAKDAWWLRHLVCHAATLDTTTGRSYRAPIIADEIPYWTQFEERLRSTRTADSTPQPTALQACSMTVATTWDLIVYSFKKSYRTANDQIPSCVFTLQRGSRRRKRRFFAGMLGPERDFRRAALYHCRTTPSPQLTTFDHDCRRLEI